MSERLTAQVEHNKKVVESHEQRRHFIEARLEMEWKEVSERRAEADCVCKALAVEWQPSWIIRITAMTVTDDRGKTTELIDVGANLRHQAFYRFKFAVGVAARTRERAEARSGWWQKVEWQASFREYVGSGDAHQLTSPEPR
jgi:hypothetical protein